VDGLSKLVQSKKEVQKLQIDLKIAQKKVNAETVEVNSLIETITEKTEVANVKQAEA